MVNGINAVVVAFLFDVVVDRLDRRVAFRVIVAAVVGSGFGVVATVVVVSFGVVVIVVVGFGVVVMVVVGFCVVVVAVVGFFVVVVEVVVGFGVVVVAESEFNTFIRFYYFMQNLELYELFTREGRLLSSANILCKQFGPRSGPTKRRT